MEGDHGTLGVCSKYDSVWFVGEKSKLVGTWQAVGPSHSVDRRDLISLFIVPAGLEVIRPISRCHVFVVL